MKITSGLTKADLADPTYCVPSKVDILIGADVYYIILLSGFLPENPCAQRTKLGWGPTHQPTHGQVIQARVSYVELSETLRKFWETSPWTV